MYPNPLVYCTCWDPWNLGPRKLIKTPHPPSKISPSTGRQAESNELPYLSNEMNLRCAEMKQNFEKMNRKLKEAHAAEISELEKNYKAALKTEMLAAQEKLEEMGKEYKYLKNMFHMYQDSIYDEMEDKWSRRKAEWEKDEKLEREKILLQQKNRMTKKYELESEEEKKKLNESYGAVFENFNREKEELMKQHESDTLKLEELSKTKEIIEEELHAQALILESLNTTLYQTQMELQREKATVGNLEKMLQTKLTEAEEQYKYTTQILTEENMYLRQKIIAKNEEIFEGQSARLTSLTIYEDNSDVLEDGFSGNKRQES
ncbi:flagellum-associated coiled-coil domain-containing protein 1-like [Choloepus didactylus]|uniref:flagellum-associated coiled-coil domain-containing protein 1-like n=1 Tax=Choloepus didactylus TaxID=27675 RepID=UPI00189FCD2E|nr:flagellum-associated coiled-coil domain-containing protein 1-like [Choloepus didactylus]